MIEKLMSRKNYLAELYELEEITADNLQIRKEKSGYEYKIRNKEGKLVEYKDPDSKSKSLYVDWVEFLKKQLPECEFPNEKHNGCEIKVKIDNKIFVLGSDYIGPSKDWAAKTFSEDDDKERENKMAKILNVCRRFGGHMIWPKAQYIKGMRITYGKNSINSINMSRGGAKGVYDRFDVTLYSLKKYYDLFIDKDKKEDLNKGLYERAEAFIASCSNKIDIEENGFRMFNLFLSFELASEWFAIFKNFSEYIKVFKLKEFTEKGEPVIWSGGEDKISKLWDKDNYKDYIENCTGAIKKRDEQIRDELKIVEAIL